MELTEQQKKEVISLIERGFPDGLATMAILAKGAGMTSAVDQAAGIVKVLTAGESRTKASIAAQKKQLTEALDKLSGKADPQSIQQLISIKRQLSELNKL
jgi:hypothetical protein